MQRRFRTDDGKNVNWNSLGADKNGSVQLEESHIAEGPRKRRGYINTIEDSVFKHRRKNNLTKDQTNEKGDRARVASVKLHKGDHA